MPTMHINHKSHSKCSVNDYFNRIKSGQLNQAFMAIQFLTSIHFSTLIFSQILYINSEFSSLPFSVHFPCLKSSQPFSLFNIQLISSKAQFSSFSDPGITGFVSSFFLNHGLLLDILFEW